MKRILLTGIGGSIGIHTFVHIMHNTDWHVIGTDSFRHKGWSDRVQLTLNDHPDWKDRLTLITHDLTSPFSELTKKKIGHVDYIISMAALSDVFASIEEPEYTIKNNVALAINLLEYAREVKPEVFVQISTDEVYGPSEGKNHGYKEWAPIVPSNPYAASKACQEAIAISYWRTYGVPVIITNTMNNFGEMQQHNKFPVMIQKWVESGQPITVHGQDGDIGSRSYIHSRNHSDAILHIIRNLKPHMHVPGAVDKPDRYNIAGDRQLDNMELVHEIAGMMGKKPNVTLVDSETRPGHDKHYGLDDSKLKATGWKSPVSFEESLKNTVQWQTEHKEWIS